MHHLSRENHEESGTDSDSETDENPEEALREKLPSGWEIASLSYPLRTSKTISEEVQKNSIGGIFANDFNQLLQVASNMPLGKSRINR